jgi:hypothetical protein
MSRLRKIEWAVHEASFSHMRRAMRSILLKKVGSSEKLPSLSMLIFFQSCQYHIILHHHLAIKFKKLSILYHFLKHVLTTFLNPEFLVTVSKIFYWCIYNTIKDSCFIKYFLLLLLLLPSSSSIC